MPWMCTACIVLYSKVGLSTSFFFLFFYRSFPPSTFSSFPCRTSVSKVNPWFTYFEKLASKWTTSRLYMLPLLVASGSGRKETHCRPRSFGILLLSFRSTSFLLHEYQFPNHCHHYLECHLCVDEEKDHPGANPARRG